MAATTTITKTQIQKAADELASMRSSLSSWLKYRLLNDKVLAGTAPKLKKPLGYAQRVVAANRDMKLEQDLANKLHALLSEIMTDAQLPNPDLTQNPDAAVQLANIALVGSSPQAMGSLSAVHPWLWPALIIGAVLLTITTAIRTQADLAAEKERLACIEAGACTDFGFFLKAGGILMVAYVAWNQLGVGDLVKDLVAKKRRRS